MLIGLAHLMISDPHLVLFMLIRGNLVSWRIKKKIGVARLSVKSQYKAMPLVTCELIG